MGVLVVGGSQDTAEQAPLLIDALIYAEVSICFQRIEDLEEAIPSSIF